MKTAIDVLAEAIWSAKIEMFNDGPAWPDKKEVMKDEWRAIARQAVEDLARSGFVITAAYVSER